jgi:phosphoglycerate dehydrogenase-like enzyme
MSIAIRMPFVLACACALLSAAPKVVVTGLTDAVFQDLQRSVPGVKLVNTTPATLMTEIVDADGVLGPIQADHFKAAKNLKWVHIHSTGVEDKLFPELIESNVVVTNARAVYGPQIADHAFAMLLAVTRKLNQTLPKQVNEEWDRDRENMVELDGKTAVIIGVGGIGGNIAKRARGFGMKTIGVDVKDIPAGLVVDRVVRPDQLDSVLPQADVLFISVPHTKKSEGMVGPKQFDLMKKGSYFIAVSRGKIYSHDGLVKALDEGRLAGAGVDVTNPEPLPKGDPLWKFKNIIITGHTSGGSDNLSTRIRNLMIENLERFSKGLPLANVVDKREGY